MEEINSTTQTFDGEVSFEQSRRKRIRIDGDDDRILLLNLSDLNIVVRMKEVYPQMSELSKKAAKAKIEELKDDDISTIDKVAEIISELDSDMRGCMDYIFDAKVSEVCAPEGTMFDMFNGQFRYEIIMDELSKLYASNVSLEYNKMRSRIQARARKYTGK